MPFGRKKSARRGRDPFAHLADERQAAESETWFLQPDDAPDLEIETGISSNLSDDDLGATPGTTSSASDDDSDG